MNATQWVSDPYKQEENTKARHHVIQLVETMSEDQLNGCLACLISLTRGITVEESLLGHLGLFAFTTILENKLKKEKAHEERVRNEKEKKPDVL